MKEGVTEAVTAMSELFAASHDIPVMDAYQFVSHVGDLRAGADCRRQSRIKSRGRFSGCRSGFPSGRSRPDPQAGIAVSPGIWQEIELARQPDRARTTACDQPPL